jgi:hypothetical protein
MDILFSEIKYTTTTKELSMYLEKKQKIDALLSLINTHLFLIQSLAMQTKTSYVQKALKYKK